MGKDPNIPSSTDTAADPASAAKVDPLPSSDEIAAVPTKKLPAFIRMLGDRFALAEQERLFAYFSYRERRTSLMLYYHRDEHLMITAATAKADVDPEVQAASRNSLELKARAEAIGRAEQNANNELKVRLKCSNGDKLEQCGG